MSRRKRNTEITLTHLSLRAAGRMLGETPYRVQVLMAESVLRGVKVVDPAGGTRVQVEVESVREEMARRERAA